MFISLEVVCLCAGSDGGVAEGRGKTWVEERKERKEYGEGRGRDGWEEGLAWKNARRGETEIRKKGMGTHGD